MLHCGCGWAIAMERRRPAGALGAHSHLAQAVPSACPPSAQIRETLPWPVQPVDGKHMMCLPTYVTRLPDGTETGECFALVGCTALIPYGPAVSQPAPCAPYC
jgi:hypothetical protein